MSDTNIKADGIVAGPEEDPRRPRNVFEDNKAGKGSIQLHFSTTGLPVTAVKLEAEDGSKQGGGQMSDETAQLFLRANSGNEAGQPSGMGAAPTTSKFTQYGPGHVMGG